MATLYVDRRDAELDLSGETIVLRGGRDQKARTPLRPIERVIVSASARLSSRLIAGLAERGVGLMILAGRERRPVTTLLSQKADDPRLRLSQYDAAIDPQAKATIARHIVAEKLTAQAEHLERQSRAKALAPLSDAARQIRAIVERLAESADIPSMMGHEGAAAAIYFPAFAQTFSPSLGFTHRNRKPPRDPVNACLSLGYTLAGLEAARAAASAGFDPDIGFLHALSAGRRSLAIDLVEVARSGVDEWAHRLFASRRLRLEDFAIDEANGCSLNKSARRKVYRAYEEESEQLHRPIDRLVGELKAQLLARFAELPASRMLVAAEPSR